MSNYLNQIDPIGESFEPYSDAQEESIAEQIYDHTMSINGTLQWINHVSDEINKTISDLETYSDNRYLIDKLNKYAKQLNERSSNILAHSNKIQDLTSKL